MAMAMLETPNITLRKTMEGLTLYKSLSDKFDAHMNNHDIHAGEAATMLALYEDIKDKTLLKSVQFHRDHAEAEIIEADKYFEAAQAVVDRFNLSKAIKQAGLKGLKRTGRMHTGHGSSHTSNRKGRKRFSRRRYGI